MANVTKKAIIRALVEGVLTDLMVKTTTENVWLDDSTTLAAKLSEMITDIGLRAKSTDVTAEIDAAINGLIDGAPDTYNTLKEISDYIAAHGDVVDGLNAAIGNKADKTTVENLTTVVNGIKSTVDGLGALATKSIVSEGDLDSALKEKINAASDGNHSHNNKALLDTYTQTEANLADAVAKKHAHSNSAVLDGITAAKVSAWDAAEGNAKSYADGLNETMDGRVAAVEADKHNHTNKTVLDGITATKVSVWDAAEQNAKTYADGLNEAMDGRVDALEADTHTHGNKAVIDGITADLVTEWNSKGTTFVQASEPANLAAGDLFIQLVD